MTDECLELKNINYQSKILCHKSISEPKLNRNLSSKNIEDFLEAETINNKKESWNKLNNTIKLQKLFQFAEGYSSDNNIVEELKSYLRQCLYHKQFQKIKDVNYDKKLEKIISIPALLYSEELKTFSLKQDKYRVSTIKNLGRGKNKKTFP